MLHGCRQSTGKPVAAPVHLIYYRVSQPEAIKIVRVLHKRMLPSRDLREMGQLSPLATSDAPQPATPSSPRDMSGTPASR